ncbi:hypothetical protein I7I50_07251 [Histoplasma capsulatum G186AR]|uniref:Uncharacterized protein n=1 Tax=Ajellomyces capsulatus TaxID=5037 RepID=A0A8H7Z069_AJECA|nr:hypothetical protein I7I52_09677 [Histoplasma capsulatum]QSS67997.1 hypothetical protein I7I50_07251 [Histoplasma capsulatum G186AR]
MGQRKLQLRDVWWLKTNSRRHCGRARGSLTLKGLGTQFGGQSSQSTRRIHMSLNEGIVRSSYLEMMLMTKLLDRI